MRTSAWRALSKCTDCCNISGIGNHLYCGESKPKTRGHWEKNVLSPLPEREIERGGRATTRTFGRLSRFSSSLHQLVSLAEVPNLYILVSLSGSTAVYCRQRHKHPLRSLWRDCRFPRLYSDLRLRCTWHMVGGDSKLLFPPRDGSVTQPTRCAGGCSRLKRASYVCYKYCL